MVFRVYRCEMPTFASTIVIEATFCPVDVYMVPMKSEPFVSSWPAAIWDGAATPIPISDQDAAH